MRLGKLLEAYRRIHGLTATALAKQMGVSPRVVARLERGDEIRSNQMALVMRWILQEVPTPPAG